MFSYVTKMFYSVGSGEDKGKCCFDIEKSVVFTENPVIDFRITSVDSFYQLINSDENFLRNQIV